MFYDLFKSKIAYGQFTSIKSYLNQIVLICNMKQLMVKLYCVMCVHDGHQVGV